ncbi:MAG: hypothetical protein KGQ93_04025 [Cyanobacteria bacterium REEB459]|nr:hypothetical protein [Cyanobacteria bacterium REEB459]
MPSPPALNLDLIAQVLAMAKTGTYRQLVFETLGPAASQRQIRAAIAQARQFGLRSVPSLRDQELGTYYQVSLADYEAFQVASTTLNRLPPATDLANQVANTQQALRQMLRAVAACSLGLAGLGGWCLLAGRVQTGGGLWLAALVVAGVWTAQRAIARRVL